MMLFEMFYVGFGQMIAAFAPNELLASILVPLFFLFVVVGALVQMMLRAILMQDSPSVVLWSPSLASLISGNPGCTTSHLSGTSSKVGSASLFTTAQSDAPITNSPDSRLHPAKLANPTHAALLRKLEVT